MMETASSYIIDGAERWGGRLAAPNIKDALYPMRAVLEPAPARLTGKRFWPLNFQALDQTPEGGTCVANGWKHWLMCEPVVQSGPTAAPSALQIYDRATMIDEWTGNEPGQPNWRAFGTSVRAGAKVMVEHKFASSFVHATSISELAQFVLQRGPVVFGVNMYSGMTQPAGLYLEPTGILLFGHCMTIIGVDADSSWFEVINSWGPNWGPFRNGRARMRFADMEKLLFHEGGDAVAAVEELVAPVPPVPPTPPAPPKATLTFADAKVAANDAVNLLGRATGVTNTRTFAHQKWLGGMKVMESIVNRETKG